jgi:hypothetical protein
LNKERYSGVFSEYRRDKIEFLPHVGLGLFVKSVENYDFHDPQQLNFDQKKYEEALSEVKSLDLDFRCIVNKLYLLKLAEDFSRIVSGKVFLIGKIK